MDKLILISGSGCAGCMSLSTEVREILPSFPDLQFEEYSIDQGEDVKRMAENFRIDKIPALLFVRNDQKVAVVYGYQPAEVLSYWLQDIIKDKNAL